LADYVQGKKEMRLIVGGISKGFTIESNKKNKENQQKTQFNFLTKKTPIVSLRIAKDKGESASILLKKTDERL
tara:strand:- start:1333 stop:1551 length:219 start_codon:yes stop_codon:yes gene_type:complete